MASRSRLLCSVTLSTIWIATTFQYAEAQERGATVLEPIVVTGKKRSRATPQRAGEAAHRTPVRQTPARRTVVTDQKTNNTTCNDQKATSNKDSKAECQAKNPVTETIDAKDINARQPTTLNEVFANSPDVVVSGGNRTAAQRVYVRGIEESNLNVTIDGAKVGGSLYSHTTDNTSIDPYMLKRVDVEPGSGSALAGPGALGGAIAYQTKDAEDLLMPGQKNGAMVRFSGETNGARFAPAAAVYGIPTDNFSYLLYGTKAWADNYKDGGGNVVKDTDNEPLEGLAKFRVRPADGNELELMTDNRQDNGMRAYRSNFGVPFWNPDSVPEHQELTRQTTSLRYSYNPSDNPLIDFKATVYDNESTLKRLINNPLTADYLTRGSDVRNRSKLGDLTLTYGYDYTWTQSRGRSGAGLDAHETGQNHGLYTQGDYALTSQWLLSAGLRYDRALLTDMIGNDYDHGHLSPNVRVRYQPVDGLSLFASWAESYRGVQPIEGMSLLSGMNPLTTNTSLTGTVSRTTQAGFEYNRNGWRAGLTGYVTKIDDAILFWNGSGKTISRRDGGDIDSVGFNTYLGHDWGNWSTDLSYAHAHIDFNGVAVTPDAWLSGVSPHGDKIGFNLGYVFPEYNLQVRWTSTVVLPEKHLPVGYVLNELPGYDVHDIFVVWRPTPAQEYSFAVTNIFDKRYWDQSTPYVVSGGTTNLYEIGRSVRMAATFKF